MFRCRVPPSAGQIGKGSRVDFSRNFDNQHLERGTFMNIDAHRSFQQGVYILLLRESYCQKWGRGRSLFGEKAESLVFFFAAVVPGNFLFLWGGMNA